MKGRIAIGGGGPGAPIITDSSGNLAGNVVNRDAHITDSNLNNDKAVTNASSTREIVGGDYVWVLNPHATDYVRVIFGDAAVTAITTSGVYLPPVMKSSIRLNVPAGATHWAFISGTGAVSMQAIWR